MKVTLVSLEEGGREGNACGGAGGGWTEGKKRAHDSGV